METLLFDLRIGLRLMRRAPLFALIAIGVLALGIGANSAIFSTVDAVLLRPLPLTDPGSLAMVWEDVTFAGFPRNTPAPGNFAEWKQRNHVFTDMAASRGASGNLTTDGPPEQVLGRLVTANFFSVLGVNPIMGRTFTDAEDRTGAPVLLLSFNLWQRRYAGDPAAINREIQFNGLKYNVIGVLPRDFAFRDRAMDFWAPIHFSPADLTNRGNHYLQVVARVKPGVTLERARQDMKGVAAQLATESPLSNTGVGTSVISLREDSLGRSETELLILMAAAGCVLLIACSNLAGLLLARAMTRHREMSVRLALGASRARLVRQMVSEGILLSAAGGALGLLLAGPAMKVLEQLVPTALNAASAPSMDLRMVSFTLLLSLITGAAFSLIPAWQASNASLNEGLKQGGRAGTGAAAGRARDALVVFEVAVCLVLLVGAGLMLQTMARLRSIDLGFRSDHLLTLRTTLPRAKYADLVRRTGYYQRVLDGVRTLPGVESAGFGSTLPFLSMGNTVGYLVEGQPAPGRDDFSDALIRVTSGDYLQALGTRMLEGRPFRQSDGETAPLVAVINESMARRYFPGQSALGHRLSISSNLAQWRTIVGVVRDVRERGYELAMKPGIYLPQSQTADFFTDSLIIRTVSEPSTLAPSIRRIISSVDSEQPVAAVRTMDEILDTNVADRSQQMTLLTAFAALALILATIGLYGVLAYSVTQRTREIGLRMALGAGANRIVGAIVLRGLTLAAIGLAIGLATAWALARTMTSLLYGISATDRMTYAAVAALLLAIAAAASWIPAIRASRVDPAIVLREE
jgi:putative ABC transport system permease protein